MKTNLEWLQEMDEPERSQAIENCKNDEIYTGDGYYGGSISKAIACSFYWDKSLEGKEYWKQIAKKYADGKH